MRRLLPLLLGPLLVLGSGGAGCSSSGASVGPHDAGAGDAGVLGSSDGASSGLASDGLPLCGVDEADTVIVGMIVTGISIDPNTPPPPVEGATFTSPTCPGLSVTTDAAGRLRGHVPRGQPFYGRLEAKGYARTIVPELLFTGDAPDIAVTLPPGLLTSLVPGYDDAHAAIFLDTYVDRATGACAKVDGVSFAVDGHPEAKVTYYSTDTIPAPVDGATATTTSGKAAISGLPGGTTVSVVATKAGCAPTLAHATVTGRSPLEAGYVTIAGVYLHDG